MKVCLESAQNTGVEIYKIGGGGGRKKSEGKGEKWQQSCP